MSRAVDKGVGYASFPCHGCTIYLNSAVIDFDEIEQNKHSRPAKLCLSEAWS